MSFSFPKSIRLRTRRQYQRVAQQSTRQVGNWIIIESRQSRGSLTRLGITVSRRYGKAVQRNRFKRIVREAFRLCREQLKPGFDLNIKPRNDALKAKPADIISELIRYQGQEKQRSVD